MSYYVEIAERVSKEVCNRMGPMDFNTAEKVERGAKINLNRKDYFTRIVKGE
jgi:hypothetical protein